MPRCARVKIENGIYHICIRGNNKQDIFLDDKDREEYLVRLRRYKERYKMHIYAYCLMTNHVHLLIYDNAQDISRFMQGLSLSYVIYFNNRHERSGHLFQERFTSVLVKSDIQILCTSKYIHCNPIKANMVQQIDEYKWSSYSAYLQGEDRLNIVDTQFLYTITTKNEEAGRKAYIHYVNEGDELEENDELATTEEANDSAQASLKGIQYLSYEEAYKILYEKWEKDEKIKCTHCFQKDESVVYLLGLISRLSCVQLAERLQVSVSIIYKKIKVTVERMIKDLNYCMNINHTIINLKI